MKKTLALIALLVFAAVVAVPAFAESHSEAAKPGSWTGWITDPHCGAKGAKAEHKDCALKCTSKGDKLVFFNEADQKLYQLDNQDLAKEHLGHQVTVKGTLSGDAIKVESIAAAG